MKTEQTEWIPQRGEKVLVWDNDESNAVERIFLINIEFAKTPFRVVVTGDEDKFLKNQPFYVVGYNYMKQLLKQETLEEADEIITTTKFSWEEDKKMYSEEEVLELLFEVSCNNDTDKEEMEEWFEQFKKK
jgi:hypothetical protein